MMKTISTEQTRVNPSRLVLFIRCNDDVDKCSRLEHDETKKCNPIFILLVFFVCSLLHNELNIISSIKRVFNSTLQYSNLN